MKYLLLFFMLLFSASVYGQEIEQRKMVCMEVNFAEKRFADRGFTKLFIDSESSIIWYSKGHKAIVNTVMAYKNGVPMMCISDVFTDVREFGPV